jgi:hypothetical protein
MPSPKALKTSHLQCPEFRRCPLSIHLLPGSGSKGSNLPGLYPITILDDNVQVEFEKGLEGTITAIKCFRAMSQKARGQNPLNRGTLLFESVGSTPYCFCYLSGQMLANTLYKR